MGSSSKPLVIRVKAGGQNYPVFIGSSLGKSVYSRALSEFSPGRLFVVFDANLYACHGRNIEKLWKATGASVDKLVIPSGERFKNAASVEKIQDWLIACGVTRQDIIIACGGGVTSDLVGFASATLFRGVRWGVCATTLVGMADASIGGKTGINHRLGKNLVGSFWHPSFVIDDLEWLSTLPPREFRSGAAEIVKCAGLSGSRLLKLVGSWSSRACSSQYAGLTRILEETIRYKSSLVARDERDANIRMWLNFGHTVGHAIEQSLSYKKLTHGEAVLLGMIAALHVGEQTDETESKSLITFREIVSEAASQIPKVRLTLSGIMSGLKTDKKRMQTRNRFILLRRPGRPLIREVESGAIERAVVQMLKDYQVS